MSSIRVQNGVEYDCKAIDTDHFEMGHNESQEMVPWADQPKYARWTMWFALATIGLFTILRALNFLADTRYRRGSKTSLIPLKGRITAFCRWIGYRHVPLIAQYTIFPAQLGLLFYSAASFLFLALICFIPHFWYRTCFKFGSPPLAVRAGLIANALTPLIYAFAGKINIITALTGVSYEKLHVFHTLTAWLSLFFAWVHTVPFLAQPVWEGGLSWLHKFYVSSIYDISGTVAIILLTVLCLFSLSTIRDRFYELFLHVHWPVAIMYWGILFWHDDNSLESWGYLWATLAVYGAGILYRAFKKTNYLQLRQTWFMSDVATITALPDKAVEVNVFTQTMSNWMPGEHIFIRFAAIQPYANHPFTIASLPEHDDHSGYTRMRLVARPYSGFTRTLYDQACKKMETQYRVFWDGTYGGLERDIHSFDNVFLTCSGSGATAVIPFLSYLARQLNLGSGSMTNICTKKIRLLWTIRNYESFEWFRNDICEALELFPDPSIVEVAVHITGSEGEQNASDNMKSEESEFNPTEIEGIKFCKGRADIAQTFRDYGKTLDGRTIVISSGCASVRFAVSNAVASLQTLVMKGQAEEVYLHTEKFGW